MHMLASILPVQLTKHLFTWTNFGLCYFVLWLIHKSFLVHVLGDILRQTQFSLKDMDEIGDNELFSSWLISDFFFSQRVMMNFYYLPDFYINNFYFWIDQKKYLFRFYKIAVLHSNHSHWVVICELKFIYFCYLTRIIFSPNFKFFLWV